jgi:hypothetical protein
MQEEIWLYINNGFILGLSQRRKCADFFIYIRVFEHAPKNIESHLKPLHIYCNIGTFYIFLITFCYVGTSYIGG